MLKVPLFYCPDISTRHELPEEEAAHALRVLRLGVGEKVQLTDGVGHFYEAVIADVSGKRCRVDILSQTTPAPSWQGHLHLAVAPTKNMDRMEWLAEKATEIGFDELSLLDCRFSERRVVKTERLDKILVAAMKQSLKATKPVLHEMMPFDKFVRQSFKGQKFIAHCYSEEEVEKDVSGEGLGQSYGTSAFRLSLLDALNPDEDALVLIGPEGDFSVEEVRLALSLGFQSVSLSASRLRTETAALVAVHLMNLTH
jgi:RNA methyltransferase, RsmE family